MIRLLCINRLVMRSLVCLLPALVFVSHPDMSELYPS